MAPTRRFTATGARRRNAARVRPGDPSLGTRGYVLFPENEIHMLFVSWKGWGGGYPWVEPVNPRRGKAFVWGPGKVRWKLPAPRTKEASDAESR